MAQSLVWQDFAGSGRLCRVFPNGRLDVYLKIPMANRQALPDGALRGGRGRFGRVHFLVEIN
jgi:hypothetical protein